MPEESLKNKTVKGVAWSAIDNVAGYAVTFIVGIILARLLSPEDYGLLGIIGIFTAICNCCINAGFSSALIRKTFPKEDDYCTTFVVNIIVSIFLYGILFITSPLIATFFSNDTLIALIRVSSLNIIIGAFAIVQRVRLTKKIDFKSQTLITIISSLISGGSGIVMAFGGFGVWALVFQGLIASLISTILLIIYNKWIPKLSFSKASFREMFGFGSKILLSSLINTIWTDIYQVVIGKCYAPSTLGQYTRATGFSSIFSKNLTGIVQRVSFPVMSAIQEDKKTLKNGYQRMIKTTMLVAFVSMLMLASIAKPLTIILVGEKWLQSAKFLQIICFGSMLYPLHALNLNMLQVQGRGDLFLNLEIIKKIVGIGPLLLGIFISIYWMLIGSVFTSFITYYLNAYYSGPILNYSIREQINDIMPSFLIALISATISYIPIVVYKLLSLDYSSQTSSIIILPIQLTIGIFTVIMLCEKTRNQEYLELKNILLKAINKSLK